MDSLNKAIEKQGEAKLAWQMNAININKELKEKDWKLQHLNWKTQSTKITAELKALEAKNAIEIEKSKKEVEVIEEQKKSLIQDRHKKLQIDWKELLDLGVPLEEANLLLQLEKWSLICH